MHEQPKDTITTAPTITGTHGKAWLVDLPEALRLASIKPEDDAGVAVWIVEAPWAHPFWHSYTIRLMHLRPMPDNRSTNFYLKGATHEIWVEALDPNHDRNEGLKTAQLRVLTPLNFAAQFESPDDATAFSHVQNAVIDICNGKLSPDTDFIQDWMKLFGDNMIKGDNPGEIMVFENGKYVPMKADKSHAGETKVIINPGTNQDTLIIPPKSSR